MIYFPDILDRWRNYSAIRDSRY